MFEGYNIVEFLERFQTDEDCQEYLASIKWQDGFCCRQCNNTSWSRTNQPFERRCNRCKHKDSVSAGTLFHKCKIPLKKAFLIVYEMSCTKKSASSYELARKYGMHQKTVWGFMQKIRKAMESSQQYPLDGTVEVDEFVVGGPEKGAQGRSHGRKKLAVMAVKYDSYGIHQCYSRVIENYGTEELKPFFEDYIDYSARIRTDKWRSYTSLGKDYQNLIQEKSNGGKNFYYIHRQIMMFKSWLRGIHHRCNHLQAYLNEFCYRFNRLKQPKKLFHNLITRMVYHQPFTHWEVNLCWS